MIKRDHTFIWVDMHVSARVQIIFGRVTFEMHPGCTKLNHSVCTKYITIYIYKAPNAMDRLDNDFLENIKNERQQRKVYKQMQFICLCQRRLAIRLIKSEGRRSNSLRFTSTNVKL